MKKRPAFVLAAAIVFAIFIFLFIFLKKSEAPTLPNVFDPQNAAYDLDGEKVTLTNGRFEGEAAPGSAAKTEVFIFFIFSLGALDQDVSDAAAVLIVDPPGGTGTFFYVSALINKPEKAESVNSIFLGDRISPQNISIVNGEVLVNYAKRKDDEPFSAKPSIGVTARIIMKNGLLELKKD